MNDATAKILAAVLVDLASDDPDIRWQAAERIKPLGPEVIRQAVGPLLVALADESTRVRVAAAWALLNGSPLPEEAIPDLMRGLLNENSGVRAWCCTLLGESETRSPGVRSALEALATTDPDDDVRWRARKALDPTEARPH